MTDGPDETAKHPAPEHDELAAKQFVRDLDHVTAYRNEVLSRDPESGVDPGVAAAVLGLRDDELDSAIKDGRLRVVNRDGARVVRVADLQEAFDDETRRRTEFAKGWTQLRANLDWDE